MQRSTCFSNVGVLRVGLIKQHVILEMLSFAKDMNDFPGVYNVERDQLIAS